MNESQCNGNNLNGERLYNTVDVCLRAFTRTLFARICAHQVCAHLRGHSFARIYAHIKAYAYSNLARKILGSVGNRARIYAHDEVELRVLKISFTRKPYKRIRTGVRVNARISGGYWYCTLIMIKTCFLQLNQTAPSEQINKE